MFGKQCRCKFDLELEPDKEEKYSQPCHAFLLDSILSCCDKRTPRQKLRGYGGSKGCFGKTVDGIMKVKEALQLFCLVRMILALVALITIPFDVVSDVIITVELFQSSSSLAAYFSLVGCLLHAIRSFSTISLIPLNFSSFYTFHCGSC